MKGEGARGRRGEGATEIEPMDRVHDLVTELLQEDADPREIVDTAKDAIRDWRMSQRNA